LIDVTWWQSPCSNSLVENFLFHRKRDPSFRGIWIGPHTAKLQENILFVLCSSARVGAGAAGLSARARHPLSTHAAPTFQGSVLLKNPKAERATLLKVWVFFHNFEDPAV
jgi:hypothetical protein